jgi:NAD(P)-dependent dehydrogenase (short-subunit alcohol dehydrogenase family)
MNLYGMSRAVVTGGASGIGAATVERLRADGMRVAAIDADGARVERIEADFKTVADVAAEAEIARAIDECAAALGGLDVCVASAGIPAGGGTVTELSLDEWERVFAVNTRGVFLTAKAVIPHLRIAGGGAFVAVASQMALVGTPGAAGYCASKGAVVSLTRAMAVDHAGEGIRVNCVCPGATATPFLDRSFDRAPDAPGLRARLEQAQLHGRLIEATEIADAIAYLVSPRSQSTIGALLVVDAGYSIH